jgi:hypothetical protein
VTAADVLERLYTTVNPVTGSRPPVVAWAVFANDTFFLTAPADELPESSTHDAIREAAIEALRDLGPVVPGTPAGDFRCTRLDHFFPDEAVWVVLFDEDDVGGVIVGPESDVEAGLLARANRQADCEAERIVLVRAFDGSVEQR